MKRSVACIAILLTGVVAAHATVFSGRVGVSSYLWERSELDSTDTRHWQNSATASLRLDRIGGQNLEISTSLRGRTDARNAGDNVNDYRVYNLQARWRDIAHRLDLTGGRQWVAWPVGSTSIDGASATLRATCGFDVGGYFGLLAPEDGRFKTTNYDDGHAFGAQLGYRRPAVGNLALFFNERHLSRTYETSVGAKPVNNLAARTIGIDWRKPIERFGSLYGQLAYDLPTERLNRVQLSARWRMSPTVSVNGQFRYRRPDLAYNSIFWVFGGSRYYEERLRLDVRLNSDWTLNMGGAYVNLVDGNITRFDAGLSHRYISFTLHGQGGASGNTFGLSGDVLYPITPKWMIRGGSNYASYDLYEDQPESNWEVSSWAGLRWQWLPQSTADVEGQFLSQNIKTQSQFAGDKSDFRLLMRITWSFFSRTGN
ncbi:MAG: hypothetical protein HY304_09600 [candidate division Zixibacteria bacterium]|nr:hypothetical protein [candidate division Zixibacteria bacterium]